MPSTQHYLRIESNIVNNKNPFITYYMNKPKKRVITWFERILLANITRNRVEGPTPERTAQMKLVAEAVGFARQHRKAKEEEARLIAEAANLTIHSKVSQQ